jgi:AraC-like DNA-binding protein
MQILGDGRYAISDWIDIPGEGETDFIFGHGWLLEILELSAGEYYFLSDGSPVRSAKNHFGVFYPAFTLVRAFARNMKGKLVGVGSEDLHSDLSDCPFIFDTNHRGDFNNVDQAFEVLEHSWNRQPISVCTKPAPVSLNTKQLIDENYLVYPSIARIANKLKISHAHLSRQFKKDYGLTPSSYLHKLRVADATFRLSRGDEIVDISMDVGYNDLSRFYKQFRKATRTSPAVCRRQVLG